MAVMRTHVDIGERILGGKSAETVNGSRCATTRSWTGPVTPEG